MNEDAIFWIGEDHKKSRLEKNVGNSDLDMINWFFLLGDQVETVSRQMEFRSLVEAEVIILEGLE
jgi:hypothetical protein